MLRKERKRVCVSSSEDKLERYRNIPPNEDIYIKKYCRMHWSEHKEEFAITVNTTNDTDPDAAKNRNSRVVLSSLSRCKRIFSATQSNNRAIQSVQDVIT